MASTTEIRTMAADVLAQDQRGSLLGALGKVILDSAAETSIVGMIALQQEVLVELAGEIGVDAIGWAAGRPVEQVIAALRGEASS